MCQWKSLCFNDLSLPGTAWQRVALLLGKGAFPIYNQLAS
jgi:hypothetical protein